MNNFSIFYQKIKNLTKPFHKFLIGGAKIRKFFPFMCIIQNMLQYYIKQITNVNPLKQKSYEINIH
jgi:hypothetical protein